jgi:iron(III) transport system permease protein
LLAALPLVVPSYVSAFAWVAAYGPRGQVQQWLEPWGVERLPGFVYGYPGALFALALFTYPYIFLLLVAALRDLDPALEESSRSLGRGSLATFWFVVLPQLRSALYGGTLLVVLYTISDFGAVSIVRYNTMTLAIYNAYRSLFDRSVAASVATVLVLLAVVFIVVQGRLQRRVRPVRSGAAAPHRPGPLGGWQWPCQAAFAMLIVVTLGTVVGVVGFWGVRASVAGHLLPSVWQAAWSSVQVSGLAAIAAVVLALPVAIWSVRYPSRWSRLAERSSYSGFALPGLVIALSVVFIATRHLPGLYQTLPILVAAYVVRFLPESLSAIRAALADVSRSFEEAARTLGRNAFDVMRTVTLPMIRPGLLAGAGLVFLTAMKELPATLILRPAGFETLATRVWSAASEGIYSEASIPSLLLLVVSVGPVYLLTIRPVLAGRR